MAHSDSSPSTRSSSEQIDDICDCFESAWCAGNQPRLESFLDKIDASLRSNLLQELILAEWDLMSDAQQAVDVEVYAHRFENDANLIKELYGQWFVESCEVEANRSRKSNRDALANRLKEGPSGSTGSGSGLQLRCPHCQGSIALVPDATLVNIDCPTCGSSFSLVNDSQVAGDQQAISRFGRFELKERLGVGAFGTVWKAVDTVLARTVAVKIPRRGQIEGDEAERFLREAKAAASLRHPNIVQVLEVGREGDLLYIVSDFVQGVPLSNVLADRRLTRLEAADLCTRIADALEHAHQAGVIHRDLKPQNVMLDADGEPRLMDFGLAKREAGEMTMTLDGAILGTPAYMSPEQARGEAHQADRRTDIYSLGVILFQALTDELPFRGNTRMLIHQVLSNEAPSPRKLNSTVPKDLETICLKCLEKEPAKRYQSAGELAEDLRRFVAGKPICARSISKPTRVWRWCKRYPLAASFAGVLVLLAIVGPMVALNLGWLYSEQARLYQETESAREEMRLRLYISDMGLAMKAWEEANVAHVQTLLNEHIPTGPDRPDYRGFQWYYLWGQIQQTRATPTIDVGSQVCCLAVSADGNLLAIGTDDATVHLYDARSLQPLPALFKDHSSPLRSMAFSPDSKRLATASWDSIRIWDVETGKPTLLKGAPVQDRQPDDSVWCLAFSPDGNLLAMGNNAGRVVILDLSVDDPESNWNELPLRHGGDVRSLEFSPNGNILATSGVKDTILWDFERDDVLWNSGKPCWTLGFSPGGETLVVDAGDRIRLLDVSTGSVQETMIGHRGSIEAIAVADKSARIASCGLDNTIKLWAQDQASAWFPTTFKGHFSSVQTVVFSQDEQRLFSGSLDGCVKVWTLTSDRIRDTLRIPHGVYSVDFSPEGTLATAQGDGRIGLWDAKKGNLLFELEGHTKAVETVRFFSDGGQTSLASAGEDGLVMAWDLNTRQPRTLEVHYDASEEVFTAVGKSGLLAWSRRDDSICVWKQDRTIEVASSPHLHDLELSPKGDLLVAACSDGILRVWNVFNQKLIDELSEHSGFVRCLEFSPDGKFLLTGGEDLKLRLWEVAQLGGGTDPVPVRTFSGHGGSVMCAAFSSDRKTLVSGSADRTIRLWDLKTGEHRGTLTGHFSAVTDLDFSPDGMTLASASWDCTVRLWRTAVEDRSLNHGN